MITKPMSATTSIVHIVTKQKNACSTEMISKVDCLVTAIRPRNNRFRITRKPSPAGIAFEYGYFPFFGVSCVPVRMVAGLATPAFAAKAAVDIVNMVVPPVRVCGV